MKTEELSEKVKHCSKCKIDITHATNKHSSQCHSCFRKHINKRRKKLKRLTNKSLKGKFKICKICKMNKPATTFRKDPTCKDGLSGICYICINKRYRSNPKNWITIRVHNANFSGRGNSDRRKETSINKLTVKGIKKILTKQKQRCLYCGISLNKDNLVLDHRLPITLGGTNLDSNIDCVCSDCNMLKFKKTAKEFKNFIKKYVNRVIAYQFETEGLK